LTSVWNVVLSRLEQRVPPEQIEEWLKPAEILQETKNLLQVVVPNDIFIDWINENYRDQIESVLDELSPPERTLKLLTKAQAEPLKREMDRAAADYAEQCGLKLNQRYLFESFVVGTSNQFAHAAALAVADSPSASYNPLFLYGSSGLGKTHLLQAIAHQLLRARRELKICYTTCEEFTNQFINSIRFNKGLAFRERFRTVDVLIIDDIQFLSGKQQTQEEFFHTFNALFEQQKQIILSCDCHPSEIQKLESRLTSRFQWGLIADIQPPALETRIAILNKKAESEGVRLNEKVMLYVASKVKTNVRELEGALVKLIAYASLGNRPIDLELAEQALQNYVKEESAFISCDKIQRFIAEQYKITVKDLSAKSNTKRIALPRQIAMYLTRKLTEMSLPEIGVAFGNKHHSTVHYSIQKIEGRMRQDGDFQNTIVSYKKSLL